MFRKALVVGVEHYASGRLPGCLEDARGMLDLLARNDDGSPNFDCVPLYSAATSDPRKQLTRALLRANLQKLFLQQNELTEVALFYYSGHGTGGALDGFLVTQDGTLNDPGVSMHFLFKLVQESKARQIVVILDCCFAGFLGGVKGPGFEVASLRPGVSLLASSAWDQASEGSSINSRFTGIILEALAGGGADVLGEVTVAGLYHFADRLLGAFDQRPVLKAHLNQMTVLRYCSPAVEVGILRQLPVWFREADAELGLSPAYEPSSSPADTQLEHVFGVLQKLTACRLVEPVGTLHMYFAAVESKSCRLTPLGKYYWSLAKHERI